MGFAIYFRYEEGNTFVSEISEGDMGYIFENLEDAQLALKRMEEHYRWQDSLETTYGDDLPQPEWWKPEPRFKGNKFSEGRHFNVMDQGEEIWLSAADYLGYFESLLSAEIRVVTPDMSQNSFYI